MVHNLNPHFKMTQVEAYSGTQAVRRAVALLKVFSDAKPEWGLTELARAAGLNKTTVYRLLTALASGEVDFSFNNIPSSQPLMTPGRVRAIAFRPDGAGSHLDAERSDCFHDRQRAADGSGQPRSRSPDRRRSRKPSNAP